MDEAPNAPVRQGCTPDEAAPVPARPAYREWLEVELPGAVCGNGSPYKFFVNYSDTSNNLLVMFEPGGACWDYESCSGQGGIRGASNVDGIPDDHMVTWGPAYPAHNRYREDNPVRDWNYVFLPYCTGDVFIGTATITYENPDPAGEPLVFHHAGHDDVMGVVSWLDEQFPTVPRLLVGGCSAGGAGALNNYYFLRLGIRGVQCGYMLSDSGPIFPSAGYAGPLHQKIRDSWNIDPLIEDVAAQRPDMDLSALDTDLGAVNWLLAQQFPNDRLASTFFRMDYNYSLYSYERFYDDPSAEEIHRMWWDDAQALMQVYDQYDNLAYFIPYYRSDTCSHCASVLPVDHIGVIGKDPYHGTEIQQDDINLEGFMAHLLDDATPLRSYVEDAQPDEGFTPEEEAACK